MRALESSRAVKAMEEVTIQDRLRELMEKIQKVCEAQIDQARESEEKNLRQCLDDLRRIAGEIKEIVDRLD